MHCKYMVSNLGLQVGWKNATREKLGTIHEEDSEKLGTIHEEVIYHPVINRSSPTRSFNPSPAKVLENIDDATTKLEVLKTRIEHALTPQMKAQGKKLMMLSWYQVKMIFDTLKFDTAHLAGPPVLPKTPATLCIKWEACVQKLNFLLSILEIIRPIVKIHEFRWNGGKVYRPEFPLDQVEMELSVLTTNLRIQIARQCNKEMVSPFSLFSFGLGLSQKNKTIADSPRGGGGGGAEAEDEDEWEIIDKPFLRCERVAQVAAQAASGFTIICDPAHDDSPHP